MHIEQVQVVKAPRDKVYAAFTDFESWPTFQKLFTRVKILDRTGDAVRIDTDVHILGRTVSRTEVHVLSPPDRIHVQGETESASNTTDWAFEPIPEGTRLTANVEIGGSGLTRLLGPFAKRQAHAMLRDWMLAFAKHVEAGE
jgi:carbon monoxide dehydrogenase subunit G